MIDARLVLDAAARMSDALVRKAAAQQAGADDASQLKAIDDRRRFLRPGERLRLERTFDDDDKLPIRYLDLGFVAARSVCRIYVPDPQTAGEASGFLVAPGLLLTNHHVLPTFDHAAASTATFDAEEDRFGRMRAPHPFELDPETLYISDPALDFAIVALKSESPSGAKIEDFGWLPLFADTGKITDHSCATVIHHPRGQPKQVTLRSNRIVIYVYDQPGAPDAANNFLYYTADTEQGSSGAPVFNDQWYVVALHRQAIAKTAIDEATHEPVLLKKDGTPALVTDPDDAIDWIANEGIRVSRILAQLQAIASSANPDAGSAGTVLSRIQAHAGNPLEGSLPLARAVAEVAVSEPFELVRRSLAKFEGAEGHQVDFLGLPVEFPVPSADVARDIALAKDGSKILHYDHFSIQMNAKRRMPIWTVVDINGQREVGHGGRPGWSYDPRMDEGFQPDDKIFTPGSSRARAFDRGHMVRQLDPVWGDPAVAKRAQDHTFCLTNVCPQEHDFNDREWGDLEDHILSTVQAADELCVVFSGPVFQFDDPLIADLLRGGPREDIPMPDIRVPRRFFKIVAWRDDSAGPLKAAGFVRDQADEIASGTPFERMVIGGSKQEQRPIAEIQTMVGLEFPGLAAVDTLASSGQRVVRLLRAQDAII
jgi:endonuclease G